MMMWTVPSRALGGDFFTPDPPGGEGGVVVGVVLDHCHLVYFVYLYPYLGMGGCLSIYPSIHLSYGME